MSELVKWTKAIPLDQKLANIFCKGTDSKALCIYIFVTLSQQPNSAIMK